MDSSLTRRSIRFAVVCAALCASACDTGTSSSPILGGAQALVFAKRAVVRADGTDEVTGGAGQVVDYDRYVPGGGLFVLEPPTPSGRLRNLTASFQGVDISGLDLSFDARQVVFSMRREGDENYHLYVANLDGSGIEQKTFGPADDLHPIWLPGGRIAFLTNEHYTALGTRADEYNHSRQVTQLATISAMAGDADRRVCSQNLSHAAEPFLMSDGRIGFSRWEHLGPVNDVKLFAMNPDCTQMVAVAGQFGKDFNSLVQAREVEPGVYFAIGTSRSRTIQAGALMRIDARNRTGDSLIPLDVQQARFTNLTPLVPTDNEPPPSGVGRYRYPRPVGGKILTSWADGDVNDRNELAGEAPNFGVYLYDPESRRRTLIYDDPATWDVYATPVAPRAVPPMHPGTLGTMPAETTPAIIGSIDVAETSLDERVNGGGINDATLHEALLQARRVRIIEGFSSEIGPVGQFGLTMHEGGAIVGEVPVYEDGSWEAEVAPLIPYHLQPIDRYGLAIRNQMLWIQAMPGESRRCGGCHESRGHVTLPRRPGPTLAQQAGPVRTRMTVADRLAGEIPWAGAASGNLQQLFDDKCASCHSGGMNDPFRDRAYEITVRPMGAMAPVVYRIPWLDLSNRSLDTYYEREAVTYPASYVTLLYPSAMMGEVTVQGEMPPEWVIPGSARGSRLIAKVNINAEDDPEAWAFPGRPHPEDVSATISLTREERLLLVRMADLGGQYWSRRNVEGASMWSTITY